MGFTEDCFRATVDEAIDSVLDPTHPWLAGIDRARLEREGHVRLNFHHGDTETQSGTQPTPFLPFAHGGFPTPSGKAEFYSESLAAQGLDPVLAFVPPTESRHTPQARTYPLELLARKADNFLNSTFANLPVIQQMEDRHLLEMTAVDAEPRGIRDGDRVRVFNAPRRNRADRPGERLRAAGRGCRPAGLGQALAAGPEHQRPHLGPAHRHGRRRHLLLGAGGG